MKVIADHQDNTHITLLVEGQFTSDGIAKVIELDLTQFLIEYQKREVAFTGLSDEGMLQKAAGPRTLVVIRKRYQIIEFVTASWSAPAIAEQSKLETWMKESNFQGKYIVLDQDEQKFTDVHGKGECRINHGPWITVDELIQKLGAT